MSGIGDGHLMAFLCSPHSTLHTYLPMKMGQCVLKRQHIKFGRRGNYPEESVQHLILVWKKMGSFCLYRKCKYGLQINHVQQLVTYSGKYPMHCNLSQVQLAVRCPVGFHIFGSLKKHMGGGQRGSMWPQEYTLCWGVCTTKTWEIPFIPAKSDACMSTPWSLGNVFRRPSHARAERGLLTR